MDGRQLAFCLLITAATLIPLTQGFAFESCYEATTTGNCTVITNDGAIGAESASSIWMQNGYMDYGPLGGCPYQNNTCPDGFSYFGWSKFRAYPKTCNDFGVLVSTQVFNIHLLGNGHLATYAWLPNGTEYYAESFEPIPLNVYLPIIVIFQHMTNNDTWKLTVIVQGQLIASADTGRTRTYKPPMPNLFFAGSGDGVASHNLSVQLDRINMVYGVMTIDYCVGVLLDVTMRQTYCYAVNGVLTNSLTCYWVVPALAKWTDAYSACSSSAYIYGYSYGRLAWFPSWNTSVWNNLTAKIASYGNGTYGYTAWIGGGQQLQWLRGNGTQTKVPAVVPSGVAYNSSGASSSSCLQINTKTYPWQWSETSCSTSQYYVCQMSFDCLINNPCKNLGECQVYNDGKNICKCPNGTSGQFCETGFPNVTCVNNCSCPTTALPTRF